MKGSRKSQNCREKVGRKKAKSDAKKSEVTRGISTNGLTFMAMCLWITIAGEIHTCLPVGEDYHHIIILL